MFHRSTDPAIRKVTFLLNGTPCTGYATDTVAAALLANDHALTKSSAISGHPRAPYCMMGVCYECLVEIDGVGNRQSCLTQLTEGMSVRTGVCRQDVSV